MNTQPQQGQNVLEVPVNAFSVNALITAFLNAAHSRGVYTLAESAKIYEVLQFLEQQHQKNLHRLKENVKIAQNDETDDKSNDNSPPL